MIFSRSYFHCETYPADLASSPLMWLHFGPSACIIFYRENGTGNFLFVIFLFVTYVRF